MKKICFFIICIMLFIPFIKVSAQIDSNISDKTNETTTNTKTTKEDVTKKESKGTDDNLLSDGKSAILIEATTGKIIYEKNVHERYAPASMTKIMSMILIMEEIEKGNLKWNETLTTSSNASSMGGSQIFLQANEKMSVKDLFKGVAIGSANDVVVTKKQSQVIGEEITI